MASMFATADSPPPPAPASLVEDCIDIWFTPSAVFARRTGGAWGPFLVTVIMVGLLSYAAMGAMQSIFDAELAKALTEMQAESPSMTEAQIAQVQRVTEWSIRFGGLVAMPFALLGLGLATWVLAKVLGGTLSLSGGVMIASFASLPKALGLLLIIAQSFVLGGPALGFHDYSLGVVRFLDPSMNPGVYALLGRIDLITIWVTVLVTLGLIHTAKVERSKAIAGGIGLWVLGGLPALLQIFRAG
jgi:hypothetical protein